MEAHIKHRALEYLVDHRAQTSRAPYSVQSDVTAMGIAQRIGVPPHNLIHTLWDLQKRDLIRFRERKYARGGVGGRGELDHFQVTAAGFAFWKDLQQSSAVLALRDPGDPGSVPDLVASVDAVAIVGDMAEERAAKPKTNGHAVADRMVRVDADAFLANIRGEDPGGVPSPVPPPVPTLDPILVRLLARHQARERLREAAHALEAAGMEDQALVVMEQLGGDGTELEDAMARHLMGCTHARIG